MHILVIGSAQIEAEFRQKFSSEHEYVFLTDYAAVPNNLKNAAIVFDFVLAHQPENLKIYAGQPNLILFCNAVNISLAELIFKSGENPACTIFGFNGWPTFINPPILEVSLRQSQDQEKLASICQQLQTDYLIVDDRVGMVTPRVISMIINEAFYTLQEGAATMEDINLALKLGTNYPFGPFEWADRIGLRNIYTVLEAVYNDTKDERYKICPLLKKQYLTLAD